MNTPKKKPPEVNFSRELDEIFSGLEKTNKSSKNLSRDYAQLASKLIDATCLYICEITKNDDLVEKYVRLEKEIFSKILDTKIKAINSDFQIACFVQALILCGAPSRKHTIEVVSGWLGHSYSKIRTIHESYRASMPETFGTSDYKKFIKLTWVDLEDFVESHKDFPEKGKIFSAYKQMHKFLCSDEVLPKRKLRNRQKPAA